MKKQKNFEGYIEGYVGGWLDAIIFLKKKKGFEIEGEDLNPFVWKEDKDYFSMHLKKSLKDPVFREEWAKQSAEKIVEMVEQFGENVISKKRQRNNKRIL